VYVTLDAYFAVVWMALALGEVAEQLLCLPSKDSLAVTRFLENHDGTC
jgi:hypothetical protein